MCEIFALHGIPDTVVSDNGPQYISQEFADFAKDMGFTHITSSPLYPQANGEVERAVQTAKNILRKNANPHLGLLAYRSAPLANGLTPSEILMGRRLRNKLPLVPENLRPRKIDQEKLRRKNKNIVSDTPITITPVIERWNFQHCNRETRCSSGIKQGMER